MYRSSNVLSFICSLTFSLMAGVISMSLLAAWMLKHAVNVIARTVNFTVLKFIGMLSLKRALGCSLL